MTEDEIRETVRQFALQFWQERTRQIGQMVPGADMAASKLLPAEAWKDPFPYMMEPQEWLLMARYGAGLVDGEAWEIYEICQSLAEWLFATPVATTYDVPEWFYETDMGALWAAAFIRVQGDELLTMTEAAALLGMSLSALSQQVSRGNLRAYRDPSEPNPQKSRRVSRGDVERLGKAE